MTWLSRFGVGLVIGLSALWAWRAVSYGEAGLVADFVSRLDEATLWRPSREVFTSGTVTLGGVSRPAVSVAQASRIAWDVTIPSHARIQAQLGVGGTAGPGRVLFRIGLSFDGHYEEVVTRELAAEDAWLPVDVDLSPYAGKAVSLILNVGSTGSDPMPVAHWGHLRLIVP